MHILVSNDDGIYSPGIAVLAEVAAEFGNVRVVAPDVERSSMGHAITASRPLSYRPTRVEGLTAYRVNGTPADCVSLGAYHWEKVDIVLSGLNLGFNLGNSIWHSGTVAAAKQAALLGLRGVALSVPAGAESAAEFPAAAAAVAASPSPKSRVTSCSWRTRYTAAITPSENANRNVSSSRCRFIVRFRSRGRSAAGSESAPARRPGIADRRRRTVRSSSVPRA